MGLLQHNMKLLTKVLVSRPDTDIQKTNFNGLVPYQMATDKEILLWTFMGTPREHFELL
jgi:hypothetical protein